MLTGYIYKCTCSDNGKIYIGQTYQTFKERQRCHFKGAINPKDPSYEHYFHRALRKHGFDKFTWEIIETIEEESLPLLKDKLNALEIFYIDKYNTLKAGYNLTKGGNFTSIQAKSIIMYDILGNKLEVFNNINDIINKYNISKNTIRLICAKYQKFTSINNKKVIFRYQEEGLDLEELKKFVNSKKINWQINVYDINGKFIQSFNNLNEAASYYNIKNIRISACCNKHSSFVLINGQRLIFRYLGDTCTKQDSLKAKSIKSSPKVKVQAINYITGEVIKEFNTQVEGAKYFNLKSAGKISLVCNGKRKSAGKYNGAPVTWKLIN